MAGRRGDKPWCSYEISKSWAPFLILAGLYVSMGGVLHCPTLLQCHEAELWNHLRSETTRSSYSKCQPITSRSSNQMHESKCLLGDSLTCMNPLWNECMNTSLTLVGWLSLSIYRLQCHRTQSWLITAMTVNTFWNEIMMMGQAPSFLFIRSGCQS